MNMRYRDYIKSEAWEERKRRYYATHPKICAVCGHPAVELHHLNYKELGREKDKDLAPLCRLHHDGLHKYAGVRGNSYYQSRAYIESEREKYRNGAAPSEPKPQAKKSVSVGLTIRATATRIRNLFGLK